jgi:hypothetical protein
MEAEVVSPENAPPIQGVESRDGYARQDVSRPPYSTWIGQSLARLR